MSGWVDGWIDGWMSGWSYIKIQMCKVGTSMYRRKDDNRKYNQTPPLFFTCAEENDFLNQGIFPPYKDGQENHHIE